MMREMELAAQVFIRYPNSGEVSLQFRDGDGSLRAGYWVFRDRREDEAAPVDVTVIEARKD